jgi:hypothetical protein
MLTYSYDGEDIVGETCVLVSGQPFTLLAGGTANAGFNRVLVEERTLRTFVHKSWWFAVYPL